MNNKYIMSWQEAKKRASLYKGGTCFGIPRGGNYVAALLGKAVDNINEAEYIVDDIVDSGKTRDLWLSKYPDKKFFSLVDKTQALDKKLGWIIFPWENNSGETAPTDAIIRLLEFIGEDINRKGLIETPKRVVKAIKEMLNGYDFNIKELFKVFDGEGKDQIVAVSNIEFVSICEHHMLPFVGHVHIAYLSNKRVIGASKIPRLVSAFAHRLQIQERITEQIADAMMKYLKPQGVAVIIEGVHSCMKYRGIKCQDGKLITSVMLGTFRDDLAVKQEVLSLLGVVK